MSEFTPIYGEIPMPRTPEKLLSNALFGPLTKAYKAGGLALAFLSLGAFLMLTAFMRSERDVLTYSTAVTGFGLILLPCVFFLFKDLAPLLQIKRNIDEKREVVDAIQAAALQMTEVASDLQALAFKHASTVSTLLQDIRPTLRQLPFLSSLADSAPVQRADALSSTIVTYTVNAKSIIRGVEDALVHSDPALLHTYIGQLKELKSEIAGALTA
jgi:hypothetical protein